MSYEKRNPYIEMFFRRKLRCVTMVICLWGKLDWLDYGARMYDASLGRFTTADPLAEEFSSWTSYHYVHNNPINLIDPTGMFADWWVDEKDGSLTHTEGDEAPDTGSNIKYLGEDGMFGEEGKKIEDAAKNDTEVNWTTSLDPKGSVELAESAGFSQLTTETTTETTQNTSISEGQGPPIILSDPYSKNTKTAIIYMPDSDASKVAGTYRTNHITEKITPFGGVRRETKTTTTYSTNGQKGSAPKSYNKEVSIGKFVYDAYDKIIKPAFKK